MTKIAITGGNGFVGLHMRFLLNEKKDQFEVVLINKEDFSNPDSLSNKLKDSDYVLHFAGLNRGEEEEIYNTNTGITKQILSASDIFEKKPQIVFLSSTHNTRETAYGRSKRDSEKMISEWGKQNDTKTVSLVAPNIYGEFVKPYYNSFVATFCYELVENKESNINAEARVNLIYVRDVCTIILDLINGGITEETKKIEGLNIGIAEVYEMLKNFKESYLSGLVPILSSKFELSMFNTLRSYLYPNHFPINLDLKTDNRGSFVEVIKEKAGGQSSFSTTHPGITRGNHYHTRKIERFCVLSGDAVIRMRKIFSDEVIEYNVSGDKPVYVDMPTYYTHSIENTGSTELLTMFWINEIYDPTDPDTFMENVII